MRRYAGALVLILAGAIAGQHYWRSTPAARAATPVAAAAGERTTARAPATLTAAQTGQVVSVEGRVERTLSDDRDGDRHQRFILRLASGQTLLIAHNIDIAPRVDALRPGETLRVRGEYVWNAQGGVLHWTHRDPGGRHDGGYIERSGRRYE